MRAGQVGDTDADAADDESRRSAVRAGGPGGRRRPVARARHVPGSTPDQQGSGDWSRYHGVANAIARGDWYQNPFVVDAGGPAPATAAVPAGAVRDVAAGRHQGHGPPRHGHRLRRARHRADGAARAAASAGRRVGVAAARDGRVYPVLHHGRRRAAQRDPVHAGARRPRCWWPTGCATTGRGRWRRRWARWSGWRRSRAARPWLLIVLLDVPVVWGARPGRAGAARRARGRFVLVLTPWTVRNLDAFGQLVPVSTQAGALVAGANCPTTYFGPELGGWSFECLSGYGPTTRPYRARPGSARAGSTRWTTPAASR